MLLMVTKMPTSSVARAIRVGGRMARRGKKMMMMMMMMVMMVTKMPTSSVARATRVGGRMARRGKTRRRHNGDILRTFFQRRRHNELIELLLQQVFFAPLR